MLSIQVDRTGAAVLRVHVQPRAAQAEVVGLHGDALKVRVTAPPADGRANDAVAALLAEALGIPLRQIELVSGHQHRQKRFRVSGLAPDEVRRRLDAILC